MTRKEKKRATERRVEMMATAIIEVAGCTSIPLSQVACAAPTCPQLSGQADLWRRAARIALQEQG